MRRPRARRRGERGSGLILSLLTLAALSLMAAAVYVVARTLMRESVYQRREMEAYWIAQAGLEDALHELALDPRLAGGPRIAKDFAEGRYEVLIAMGTPPRVVSTGYSGSIALFGAAHVTVSAYAKLESGNPLRIDLPNHVGWEPGTWSAGPAR